MTKTVPFNDAWAGEADCRSCTLRESVLFAGLREEDFEKIHQPIDQYKLKHGDVLYHAGAKAERLFTIRSGVFKLVQYLPDGTQRIVRLVRSTDITGLEALLDQPYQHDAVALFTAEVCALPVEVIRRLSNDNPSLHQELLRRWQKALDEADAWLTQLSTGSAKQRVARLLLRLLCGDQDTECELFSREDMGAMLGITTETTSRTIAEFKRQGLLIETSPHHFRLNSQALHEIAGDPAFV